jgi:hypothetical protein
MERLSEHELLKNTCNKTIDIHYTKSSKVTDAWRRTTGSYTIMRSDIISLCKQCVLTYIGCIWCILLILFHMTISLALHFSRFYEPKGVLDNYCNDNISLKYDGPWHLLSLYHFSKQFNLIFKTLSMQLLFKLVNLESVLESDVLNISVITRMT